MTTTETHYRAAMWLHEAEAIGFATLGGRPEGKSMFTEFRTPENAENSALAYCNRNPHARYRIERVTVTAEIVKEGPK